MKKTLLTIIALCSLAALTACAAPWASSPGQPPEGSSAVETSDTSSGPDSAGDESIEEPGDPSGATTLCRIVSGAEDGDLLLAGQEDSGGIYRLTVGDTPITWKSPDMEKEGLQDGMLVEVAFDGDVFAVYPSLFSNVSGLTVLEVQDNLCSLYLQVLEDLWEADPALNGEEYLGVDLSETRLSPSEQAAVAWAFGEAHGLTPLEGTLEELAQGGYLTDITPQGADQPLYQWEDGCLFSIREKPMGGTYSLPTLSFDASKWCSPRGAYFFSDCTSVQSAKGRWGGYQVDRQAIS